MTPTMTPTIARRPRPTPVPGPEVRAGTPAPPVKDDGHRVREVLEAAREVVERGWLQHRWYRTAPRPWRERLFGPMPGTDRIEGACLVAAVVVAGHSGGAFTHVDRDSGPALDRVWDALQERSGRPVTGGVTAPVVRRARMRDLVDWNDAPGRPRDDVLDLLDRAISRTISDRMRVGSGR